MKSRRFGALVLLAATIHAASLAQPVPQTINYQGRLTDNTPQQDPITATVSMGFSIWDAPAAGTQLWQEPLAGGVPVSVVDGIFSQILGSSVPLPPSVFSGATNTRYLEITIDPGMPSQEVLQPRQVLTSSPYAGRADTCVLADDATRLGGIAPSGYVATAGSYANPAFITSLAGSKITGSVSSATTAGSFTGSLGGDVTGTQGATSVTKLRGQAVSAAVPPANSVLSYSGGTWAPDPTPALDGIVLPDGALGPQAISADAATKMGSAFTSVTSTPPVGAWGNLANISFTAPGAGKVRVDAWGHAAFTSSNALVQLGIATTPSGSPGAVTFAKSSATLRQSGFPEMTLYGGTGDGSAAGTFTMGYEIVPLYDIVVFGSYSNRGSYVRVWRESDQLQVLGISAPTSGGTWEYNYTTLPVCLQAGTTYIVTIDVSSSTYDRDNTPFSGVGTFVTLGDGRYASGAGTFPASTDASTHYGGVGLQYYRIASGTDFVPASVSTVLDVPSAGSYTYYLNGLKTEQQSAGGSCTFSVQGMSYVFAPTLGQ